MFIKAKLYNWLSVMSDSGLNKEDTCLVINYRNIIVYESVHLVTVERVLSFTLEALCMQGLVLRYMYT